MRVLLFGEFSGFHNNLKAGLKKNGVDVTLLSYGDGFKKIEGDINITSKIKNRLLRALFIRIKMFYYLLKFKKYDVVQVVEPQFIPFLSYNYNLKCLKFLKKRNKKVFFAVCGGNPYMIPFLLGELRYSPYSNAFKEKVFNTFYKEISYSNLLDVQNLVKYFDGIVSTAYEYELPYKNASNYLGFITFPARELSNENILINNANDKIKIFHGISRSEIKGSKYIVEAMERIVKNFPNKVTISVVEKVPYNEYISMFDDCHIFIDQACSYSYAMNTLLALEKNKVVLSGCEKEVRDLLGNDCPVINILPDSNFIYEKLRELVLNPEKMYELANKGYSYLNKVHNNKSIAKKYIEKWNQTLK